MHTHIQQRTCVYKSNDDDDDDERENGKKRWTDTSQNRICPLLKLKWKCGQPHCLPWNAIWQHNVTLPHIQRNVQNKTWKCPVLLRIGKNWNCARCWWLDKLIHHSRKPRSYVLKPNPFTPWDSAVSPLHSSHLNVDSCSQIHTDWKVHSTSTPKSPRRETIQMPINGRLDKAWAIHTVGNAQHRAWANYICMQQCGRLSQTQRAQNHSKEHHCLPDTVVPPYPQG